MGYSDNETLKRFHAIEELDNATVSIETGMAVLQQSQPFTRNHFVVSVLLSVGMERFMKVLLALHSVSKTGGISYAASRRAGDAEGVRRTWTVVEQQR